MELEMLDCSFEVAYFLQTSFSTRSRRFSPVEFILMLFAYRGCGGMTHRHDVAVPLRQAVGARGEGEVRVLPERENQVLLEPWCLHAKATSEKR